jgi:hypothetical protein
MIIYNNYANNNADQGWGMGMVVFLIIFPPLSPLIFIVYKTYDFLSNYNWHCMFILVACCCEVVGVIFFYIAFMREQIRVSQRQLQPYIWL